MRGEFFAFILALTLVVGFVAYTLSPSKGTTISATALV